MSRRLTLPITLFFICAGSVLGQGLDTTAQKDDWEEINFEFDSAVLTDGYPSLLRLAELLNQNTDYKVALTGHTDFRGSDQYNSTLGQRRAEMVKSFLVKYGAREGQIQVVSQGEGSPKVPNETNEGRWMNRRVTMDVTDGEGRRISDGGVRDAIESIEKSGMSEDCCNEILDRLSKLDEILDLLKNLKNENDALKEDVEELKAKAAEPPQYPQPPTPAEVATAVRQEVEDYEQNKPQNKYATFNVNAGPSSYDGNLSVTGQGRVFVPFAKRHAIQSQGEYMHYFGRDEGQVDLGLVSRYGDVQIGGFSSFKYVKFSEWDRVGGLGQAAFTLDYIFDRGRVGAFGTKAFLDGAVVNSALLRRNVIEETYLNVVDQAGFSAAVAAWGPSWFEGNIGALFREGGGNKPGGTIRYIHPLNKKGTIAFTMEGGLNETFVTNSNSGRFVVGLQFGKWMSPNNYGDSGEAPVPVDVPRVRYEVLTREIRTGNDSPVADAGPDLIGIEAGEITLDGSGSFDPDGDPITYEWTQVGGDPVELSGTMSPQASFTAAEGQSYFFRLTVKDDQGGMGTDRVTVTVDQPDEIIIRRFRVEPGTVNPGDPVTITWDVENAERVEITGLGEVGMTGQSTIPVNQTTNFTLTATAGDRTASETQTVEVVAFPLPTVVSFTADPQMIERGDSTLLSWQTEGADSVMIDGIGSVGTGGSATVSPTETTTYRLTARNDSGEIVKTTTVTVVAPNAPRILTFVANPAEIGQGEPSTLIWEVENADQVTISELGPVDLAGTSDVTPAGTTTYTLTASNVTGEVSATATVTVRNPVRIVEFKSNKTTVANPGDPAELSWVVENATQVELVNYGQVGTTGTQTVNPVGETVYTLIAYGVRSQVEATVILTVENENRSPIAIAEAPRAILVPAGTLTGTGTLDGSKSYDPDKDPITYQWRSIGPLEVTIKNPTAVQPTVEFLGGYGRYLFELMVTDDKGAMGMDTVEVWWVDP